MEKISRIIPANARTKAVDVSGSQPVRPGAPTYGRPVGRVTRAPLEVQDRVSLSTAERAITQHEQPLNYRDRVEARRAQIAERVSAKFFGGPTAPQTSPVEEETATGVETLSSQVSEVMTAPDLTAEASATTPVT